MVVRKGVHRAGEQRGESAERWRKRARLGWLKGRGAGRVVERAEGREGPGAQSVPGEFEGRQAGGQRKNWNQNWNIAVATVC